MCVYVAAWQACVRARELQSRWICDEHSPVRRRFILALTAIEAVVEVQHCHVLQLFLVLIRCAPKQAKKPKPKKNQVWVAVPPAISSHHFMHSTTFKNKPPLAAATITRSSNSALFAPSPLSLFAFAIMSKCPKKESLTICNNTRRKSAPVPRKKEKKNNGASDNNDDEQWQGQWWWECCCLKPSQPGPTLAGRGST